MRPLLSVKNLAINFKNQGKILPALRNISFDVSQAEIAGIVGESGSGKSVTALSILKLLDTPPADYVQGEILFQRKNGNVINLMNCDDRLLSAVRGTEIGMVFQEPMTSLNPVYTCGEQVAETLIAHFRISRREAKNRTIGLFERVQLPQPKEMLRRYPHELSGGQKQRVMIAIAIACNPQLLIADEPTTALDMTVQKAILCLLRDLQQQMGMSIIFITHDLGVVAELAFRLFVMHKGEIVEEGAVKKIFTHPEHPYTKGLLACRPSQHLDNSRLPTMNDFLEISEGRSATDHASSFSDNTNIAFTFDEEKSRKDNQDKNLPLLEVKNLTARFPAKKNFLGKVITWQYALNNVSIDVKKGETVGLVGESGCGKTTLSRAILKLIDIEEGEIIYRSEILNKLTVQALRGIRRHLQIIFQDPYSSLNPRHTIGDAIMEPMVVHGLYKNNLERRERVTELLNKVGLKSDYFDRYPHEFSGGQRQRIAIARALAIEPDFIICDESVAALDVSIQAQVLNLLRDLQDELQLTYIFISHDLSVVKFMSNRILVMKDGGIVEEGAADAIYNSPQTKYTQQLIEAIPAKNYL
jgi:peptide/nickel transport system ATP-binding protein